MPAHPPSLRNRLRMSVAFNRGHSQRDMQGLLDVTTTGQAHLLEVWNEHFGH